MKISTLSHISQDRIAAFGHRQIEVLLAAEFGGATGVPSLLGAKLGLGPQNGCSCFGWRRKEKESLPSRLPIIPSSLGHNHLVGLLVPEVIQAQGLPAVLSSWLSREQLMIFFHPKQRTQERPAVYPSPAPLKHRPKNATSLQSPVSVAAPAEETVKYLVTKLAKRSLFRLGRTSMDSQQNTLAKNGRSFGVLVMLVTLVEQIGENSSCLLSVSVLHFCSTCHLVVCQRDLPAYQERP